MSLAPGTRLGQYEILSAIAAGGMSESRDRKRLAIARASAANDIARLKRLR